LVIGSGLALTKFSYFPLTVALRIAYLSEILEVCLPEEEEKAYNYEEVEWKVNKKLVENVQEVYKRNILASTVNKSRYLNRLLDS